MINKIIKRIFICLIAVCMIGIYQPINYVSAATKLSSCTISLSKTSYNYTASACKPTVTVKYKKSKLKSGKDYTVTYSNNTNPGTATVTIKGKGAYTGSVKKTFKIKNTLTLSLSKKTYSYSATACKPTVTVKSGSKKLTSSNYTITYKNNTNAGTASVIVKGKSKYKGKNAYITFKINPLSIASSTVSLTNTSYISNGQPCTPDATVKLKVGSTTKTLKKNTDYTISYKNNVNPGIASMTITGKGNYSGSKTLSFQILNNKTYSLSHSEIKIKNHENSSISINDYDNQPFQAISKNLNIVEAVPKEKGIIDLYPKNVGTTDVEVTIDEKTLICHVEVVSNSSNSNTPSLSNIYIEDYIGTTKEIGLGNILSQSSSTITWTSADPQVASIKTIKDQPQKRKIELLSVGSTVISATDGTTVETCQIVVKDEDRIKVTHNTNNTYDSIMSSGNHLSYGQSASSVLGALDLEKTSQDELNHVNGMASCKIDNTWYYFVTDTWNNRVLCYKGDTVQNALKSKPSFVLGQNDFNSNKSGNSLSSLNWPMSVAIDEMNNNGVKTQRLYIADTHNNRILVFDDITKLQTGSTASHSLEWFSDDHSTHMNHIYWPWAVSTDVEGKLIVTSTLLGHVLIWDTKPQTWESDQQNYYPSTVLDYGISSTPRSITWTNKQLIIGDENLQNSGRNGFYVYNNFPTSSSSMYDFKFETEVGYGEGVIINNQLLMVYENAIHIWKDGKIDSANDNPDILIKEDRDTNSKDFLYGGGTNKLLYVDNQLYLSLFNRSCIVGWSQPSNILNQVNSKYDIYIGNPKYENDNFHIASDYLMHNPIPVTDGKHFVIADDLEQKIYVYNKIPTSSHAKPDYVYTVPHEIGDIILYTDNSNKTTMAITCRTQNKIYIWNNYQFDGSLPDTVLSNSIGSYQFTNREMNYLEYDGTYFYVYAYVNNIDEPVILVYKGIPEKNSEPIALIKGMDFGNCAISSNGQYAAVMYNTNQVALFKTSQFENNSLVTLKKENAVKIVESLNFNGKNGNFIQTETNDNYFVYKYLNNNIYENIEFGTIASVLVTKDGHLAISDMAENRVIIYDTVEDAINNTSNFEIIGHSENTYEFDDSLDGTYGYHDKIEATSKSTLCMPRYLAFDGSNLWVGEFKFSNRLLRFELK